MAARTATVQNICAQPGTPLKAITRGQVAVKLNTISFTIDGTTEKARHRYTDVDLVTGHWSMVLELNDDLDPAGTYWVITEPTGATWTIQLTAAHAGLTVQLRDVLQTNPLNPDPLVITHVILQGNLDGGAPDSVYTASQTLDGGTP